MKKRFDEVHFSPEHRYSLGIDRKVNGFYLAIPVSNGVVDYDEHYVLTREQYESFLADEEVALNFVERCRRRENDDLLIYEPGTNRGTPV
ncbi:hypothetical protein [[Mycobacterium] wendilense]|uniref:Uncharacterized protein n=1 Tax=[Mycobacterium] wendilense TaxID=3064284 RepID=A0ABM9MIP9_9MYCO|nr:hypothetical protein [Mycolicibacterium sp. MU0050]CAJ1586152.1 hypothetical protein MU0050_004116 [Mycolicibacterium sp. MU0050]